MLANSSDMIDMPDAALVNTTNALPSCGLPKVKAVKGPLSPQWKNVPAPGSRPQPSPHATPVARSSALGSSHWMPGCFTSTCGDSQSLDVSLPRREPASTARRKRA